MYVNRKNHIELKVHHHHHQPINVPTTGAKAFLMNYPQGEWAITHHAGPVRIGGLIKSYVTIMSLEFYSNILFSLRLY
jgi:hypothetical protein